MGRNSVESIIEDFVKGAREGGFKGNIVVSRDNFGHEEKLASTGSTLTEAHRIGYEAALKKLGFLGSMIGPLAGVLAGPAARAAMPALGKRVGTGLGSMAFDAVAGQAANSAIDRMRGARQ